MTTETTYKTMTLVNQLPTISLEELVNQAAMMTRVDRKYTVSRTQAPDIFAELSEQTLCAANRRYAETVISIGIFRYF
jgi:hypothetical protein